MKILVEEIPDRAQGADLFDRAFTSLAEAIDEYCPSIKITVEINGRGISVDPCRDLYGLHEDGLDLVECLAFDRESNVGYPEILPRINEQQKTYGILLTEGDRPRVLVCRAERNTAHIETRTLIGGVVVKAEADEEAESDVSRSQVILEFGRFLMRLVEGLGQAAPQVTFLDDYRDYVHRVSVAMARASDWMHVG
jgi:hypothetical protein